MRRRKIWILLFITGLVSLFFTPQIYLILRFDKSIYNKADNLPKREYGVVFGARVRGDSTLSDATRERTEAAVILYRHGAIQKIFVSGDNRNNEEAVTIGKYAESRGVPAENIIVDRLGIDTQDTCRHFLVTGAGGILLSQEYHLPRALYLCENEGVEPIGLAVNRLEILEKRGDNFLEIYAVRVGRFVRESFLTWTCFLGVYGYFSDEAEKTEKSLTKSENNISSGFENLST